MRDAIFPACVLIVAAIGCTAISKMASPELKGSPETTGLLVVECEVTTVAALFGIRTSNAMVEGLLSKDGRTVQTNLGKALHGTDVLVFSGLEPGRWTFTSFRCDWTGGDSVIRKTFQPAMEEGLFERLTVDVVAGEPTYLGVLEGEESHGKAKFELHPDAAAEANTWKRMLAVYDNTAWTEPMRMKLAASSSAAK